MTGAYLLNTVNSRPESIRRLSGFGRKCENLILGGLLTVHPVVTTTVGNVTKCLVARSVCIVILRGKQLGIFDKNQRIGSQYIGVSPWIDKQIAVGVVIERKRYFSCFAELLYQLCFGLAKGSSTSKGFRAAVGRRPAVVVSPIVAIITIEVNPKRAVTIIAPVFTPHPATVGISGVVVYIAIGVNTRDKVHL